MATRKPRRVRRRRGRRTPRRRAPRDRTSAPAVAATGTGAAGTAARSGGSRPRRTRAAPGSRCFRGVGGGSAGVRPENPPIGSRLSRGTRRLSPRTAASAAPSPRRHPQRARQRKPPPFRTAPTCRKRPRSRRGLWRGAGARRGRADAARSRPPEARRLVVEGEGGALGGSLGYRSQGLFSLPRGAAPPRGSRPPIRRRRSAGSARLRSGRNRRPGVAATPASASMRPEKAIESFVKRATSA